MPKSNVYSVHPACDFSAKVVANMKDRTGKSIEEWVNVLASKGPKNDRTKQEAWLKKEFGLGHNYGWFISARLANEGEDIYIPEAYLAAAPKYVEKMYEGKKTALKPIYDKLLKLGLAIGKDVKACPCTTMVPLYRKNCFAQLKPTTNTRLDLGLFLRGYTKKLPPRVIPTGGLEKKDRITHRIGITSVDEIDDEVKRWMKTAYDLADPAKE